MRRLALLIAPLWLNGAAALASDMPCLTASGAPQPDPVALLAAATALEADGSAVYLDRFELRDFDGDGRADILILLRDESYDGNPVYGLTYYRGEAGGYCGRQVFDGLAALPGAYELTLQDPTGGYPGVAFRYVEADPVRRTATPMLRRFRFDPESGAYRVPDQ